MLCGVLQGHFKLSFLQLLLSRRLQPGLRQVLRLVNIDSVGFFFQFGEYFV